MHSKAKAATKAEKKRFEKIVELGCVCCRMDGQPMALGCLMAEIHHLLDGGVRVGHHATVGLCFWHHRGALPLIDKDVVQTTDWMGPSLYHDGRSFHAHYGSDDELLAYQNSLLASAGSKS